jgi:hypothetical protein
MPAEIEGDCPILPQSTACIAHWRALLQFFDKNPRGNKLRAALNRRTLVPELAEAPKRKPDRLCFLVKFDLN